MTSHLLFSNHVTIVANFEKFLISPGFLLNFRKVTKFQRISPKALRVMEKKLRAGSLKTPPNRIGFKTRQTFLKLYDFTSQNLKTTEDVHLLSLKNF